MLRWRKKPVRVAPWSTDIGLTLRSLAAFALEKIRWVQLDAGCLIEQADF